jgi:hypothetical protein
MLPMRTSRAISLMVGPLLSKQQFNTAFRSRNHVPGPPVTLSHQSQPQPPIFADHTKTTAGHGEMTMPRGRARYVARYVVEPERDSDAALSRGDRRAM